MPNVKFFHSNRSKLDEKSWFETFEYIKKLGYEIHTEPKDCDISVALSGKWINPLPLKGKRVLLYRMNDWTTHKWNEMYGPVLEEYYDEMIDIEEKDLKETIEEICKADC